MSCLIEALIGVSLGDYIARFQGLAIMWREIDIIVQPKYRLVTQIVENIEDLVFYGPCESINNCDQYKCTFRDVAANQSAHEISKMTAQIKKAIENEVNSLLLGSGSNKRRATGEQKALRAIRLGDQKDNKTQEERITPKVMKMMPPEARISIRSGEEVKIILVKDICEKEVKYGGVKMSQQHKRACGKLLLLTHSEEKKMTPLI